LEYVLVGVVLLLIILALGALADRLQQGLFVEHALKSASHAATENSAGTIGDIILY
jgi:hypothetical protein